MIDLPAHIRGDVWQLTVNCDIDATGHTWTGVVARCQLRRQDGSMVYDLGASGGITTTITTDGKLVVGMTVPANATRLWSGSIEGDLELSRNSPAWGPYTPFTFRFEVRKDRTR